MSEEQEVMDRLDKLRIKVDLAFKEALAHLIDVLQGVRENSYTLETLCDMGWMCRQIEAVSDELRKESKARKELIGRLLSYRKVTQCQLDGGELTVHGKKACAMPNVRHELLPPKAGSAEYDAMCKHFGISEDAKKTKCVQFHYKYLGEYATHLATQGRNLPDGVMTPLTVFTTTFRTKKK